MLEGGAAAVTHRAVAARAGTSLAATTYHFATLDDLLVVAFELLTDRMVDEVQRFADLVLSGRMDLVDAASSFVAEADSQAGHDRAGIRRHPERTAAQVDRSGWSTT